MDVSALDRSEDLELSSSMNSSELPTAQDYQISEENFYFASVFDDDIDSDVDEDVMAKDVDGDITDLEGGRNEVAGGNAADGSDGLSPTNWEVDFKLSDSPDQTKQPVVGGPQSTESAADGHVSEFNPPAEEKTVGSAGSLTSVHSSSILTHVTAVDKTPPSVQSSAARPSLLPHPPISHLPPRSQPPPQQQVRPFPACVEERELPVMSHRKRILELVRCHRVICIEGETGCGKSTKIPQFILDDSLKNNPAVPCRILVTQPHRVAVIELAKCVAAERKESIGHTVGYCIGGEQRRNSKTSLTYCTVGYMLHVRNIHEYTVLVASSPGPLPL